MLRYNPIRLKTTAIAFVAMLLLLAVTNADAQLKTKSPPRSAEMKPVDFDGLSRKANKSGFARKDLEVLFGAVFSLTEWNFISRGQFPNVNPYIASNRDYAEGKDMVRAFTDTDRLQRFAKENSLTQPNGEVLILTIPTEKVIEYLEQFIDQGVHGVWFNSDIKSDGFFVPLRQLRPIEENLKKLNLIKSRH